MAKKILLIDDEPGITEIISLTLELEGYRVELAGDAEEGLRRARAAAPDLVLLDIMMPGKDGWYVFERLRQDPATAAIPIVVFTAKQDALRHEYISRVAAVLPKPYKRQELLALIAKLTGPAETKG